MIKEQRMQKQEIIAITGNAGKTTTKEMLACIIQKKWKIVKTFSNGNSPYFIKKCVKELDESYHAAVLEYGMQKSGDIAELCQILQPNIGIITNVGLSHIGSFKDGIKAIAAGKTELIKNMLSAGKLYLNADDENSKLLDTSEYAGTIIYIGIKNSSAYHAHDIFSSENGIKFKMNLDNAVCEFQIPILGRHNVYNALFAIAVSHQLGFTPFEIKTALASFKAVYLRLNLYKYENYKLIDDTHNASPESTIAAIDVLCEIGKANNILILAASHGQGNCDEGYIKSGKYIASQKISFLYTMENKYAGPEIKQLSAAAIEAGFPPDRVMHFKNISDFYLHFKKQLTPGATCLVKGAGTYFVIRLLRLFPLKPIKCFA